MASTRDPHAVFALAVSPTWWQQFALQNHPVLLVVLLLAALFADYHLIRHYPIPILSSHPMVHLTVSHLTPSSYLMLLAALGLFLSHLIARETVS